MSGSGLLGIALQSCPACHAHAVSLAVTCVIVTFFAGIRCVTMLKNALLAGGRFRFVGVRTTLAKTLMFIGVNLTGFALASNAADKKVCVLHRSLHPID